MKKIFLLSAAFSLTLSADLNHPFPTTHEYDLLTMNHWKQYSCKFDGSSQKIQFPGKPRGVRDDWITFYQAADGNVDYVLGIVKTSHYPSREQIKKMIYLYLHEALGIEILNRSDLKMVKKEGPNFYGFGAIALDVTLEVESTGTRIYQRVIGYLNNTYLLTTVVPTGSKGEHNFFINSFE